MVVHYQFRQSEDVVLVGFSQDDDSRAFDELARRHQDKVQRLSCWTLRHEDDDAEAPQKAFLSAHRGRKNFEAASTFSTRLDRIATIGCPMKCRRRRDTPHPLSTRCMAGTKTRRPQPTHHAASRLTDPGRFPVIPADL